MKVISYSIFRAPCEKFEFMAYMRGLYFNVRMNQLIYPDWKTIINFNEHLGEFKQYLYDLKHAFPSVLLYRCPPTKNLCEMMLWRMYPMFVEGLDLDGSLINITHLLCRDADAITTYREALEVDKWVDSGSAIHCIHDNPAHSGLMGGMIGVRTDAIKGLFKSWEGMISGFDLSKRGSDQDLLNKRILPHLKESVMWSKNPPSGQYMVIDKVSPKLWEGELTCRHIGSAGVVEMETLRFFKRFDKTDYSEFEKQHSDILYWAR